MAKERTNEIHASFERLMRAAIKATAGSDDAISDEAGLRMEMGVTSGRFTNWKARGISQDGALMAQRKFGCSANWLLYGTGQEAAENVKKSDIEVVSPTMGETETPTLIPTSVTYTPKNLKSAILLLGSLLGKLDERSRKLMGHLLSDLAEAPDDAEDVANKASALATTQKAIARDERLNKALTSSTNDVETRPAELPGKKK